MLPTYSPGSRHTICNYDLYVPTILLFTDKNQADVKAQEPIKSPHASPIAAPRKKDKDVFDVVDDSESSTNEKGQMNGKKVAMMLGRAIWLTIKFIVYVQLPAREFPRLSRRYCQRPQLTSSAAAMSAIGKPTQSSSAFTGGVDDKIQSLRVWEPPSFCLAFFWCVSFHHSLFIASSFISSHTSSRYHAKPFSPTSGHFQMEVCGNAHTSRPDSFSLAR